MIDIEYIRSFFPATIARDNRFDRYMLKEYLSKAKPNLEFLAARSGISSMEALKTAVSERLKEVDLNQKKRDFMHLLFNEKNAERILQFPKIVNDLN